METAPKNEREILGKWASSFVKYAHETVLTRKVEPYTETAFEVAENARVEQVIRLLREVSGGNPAEADRNRFRDALKREDPLYASGGIYAKRADEVLNRAFYLEERRRTFDNMAEGMVRRLRLDGVGELGDELLKGASGLSPLEVGGR